MKKLYTKPEVEIVKFTFENILNMSDESNVDLGGNGDLGDGDIGGDFG